MRVKLLLLFFVFSFLFRSDQSFDQDLGRHIKLGEIILTTHQIPKTNLFSYTNPDFPFINTHWLFEVIAYIFFQTVGIHFFLVLKILIFLISVWIILKLIPPQNSTLLLPLGFIFLHVLRERLELRPEIFSFLFTTLVLFILERFSEQKTKLIYLLPIIQFIWINTHIYFFVGFVIQAIFLLQLSLAYLRNREQLVKLKFLSIIFLGSMIFSLLNPNGISGLTFPLNVNQNYGYTIVENQTIFLLENIGFKNPNFIYVKASIGLIILSLIWAFLKRKFITKDILISIFGVALSLLNVRSFPYLFFLSFPLMLQNFGVLKNNLLTKTVNLLVVVLIIVESLGYLSGSYYKSTDDSHEVGIKMQESVSGAMDFVITNNLPQPIFNNFDIGSYIIYRGYPKYKVFVDGRPEAYPKEFFQNIYMPIQSDYSKFKEEEKVRGFKTVIFSHTDQTPWGKNFLQNIIKDKDWNLIYLDDFMVVFVKDSTALEKKLPSIDLLALSPSSYSFSNHVSYLRMGLFLLNNSYKPPAEQFTQKAMQIYPHSPLGSIIIQSIRY